MKYFKLFEEFNDEPKPIILKNIEEIIKYNLDIYEIEYSKIEEIGYGGNGIAYDIGNNLVLKLTTSFKEYEISKKVKGRYNEHIVHVYDCGRLYWNSDTLSYNNHSTYLIIKEKIPNLSKIQKEIISDLISLYYDNFSKLNPTDNYLSNQLIKVYTECEKLEIPTEDIGSDNLGIRDNKLILFDY